MKVISATDGNPLPRHDSYAEDDTPKKFLRQLHKGKQKIQNASRIPAGFSGRIVSSQELLSGESFTAHNRKKNESKITNKSSVSKPSSLKPIRAKRRDHLKKRKAKILIKKQKTTDENSDNELREGNEYEDGRKHFHIHQEILDKCDLRLSDVEEAFEKAERVIEDASTRKKTSSSKTKGGLQFPKDRVGFGERVDAPPRISTLPKKEKNRK